jgi:hypothetical protein
MKNDKVIDMEKREGVFIPVVRPGVTTRVRVGCRSQRRDIISSGEPQQIGKILEGIVIDFFRVMRRGMFR